MNGIVTMQVPIHESVRLMAEAHRHLLAISPARRREIREDAGFTLSGFASYSGISAARLSSYEKDVTPGDYDGLSYWNFLKEIMPPPSEVLTEEERLNVLGHFEAGETCKHCRGIHSRACPRVKSLTYHGDGALAKVEFWEDDKWPKDNVLFLDSPEITGEA